MRKVNNLDNHLFRVDQDPAEGQPDFTGQKIVPPIGPQAHHQRLRPVHLQNHKLALVAQLQLGGGTGNEEKCSRLDKILL